MNFLFRSSYLSVKVGHHKGSEPQMQMRRVQRYITHEGFSKGQVHNDVAVIKMVSPFMITDYVKLACLPNAGYIVPAGSNCVVTGWGRTYGKWTIVTTLQSLWFSHRWITRVAFATVAGVQGLWECCLIISYIKISDPITIK